MLVCYRTTVTVFITNVNDNAPRFAPPPRPIQLPEHFEFPPRAILGDVSASDQDDDKLTYNLCGNSNPGKRYQETLLYSLLW